MCEDKEGPEQNACCAINASVYLLTYLHTRCSVALCVCVCVRVRDGHCIIYGYCFCECRVLCVDYRRDGSFDGNRGCGGGAGSDKGGQKEHIGVRVNEFVCVRECVCVLVEFTQALSPCWVHPSLPPAFMIFTHGS